MTNDEMNRMVRRHKTALTRAKNSGDPQKVLTVCENAFRDFDTLPHGWPDNWHLWNIASQDAEFALRRQNWA